MLKYNMNIYETGLITMNKGKIIVLEGLDGCGKSTQLNILFNNLKSAGGVPHPGRRVVHGGRRGQRRRLAEAPHLVRVFAGAAP